MLKATITSDQLNKIVLFALIEINKTSKIWTINIIYELPIKIS